MAVQMGKQDGTLMSERFEEVLLLKAFSFYHLYVAVANSSC